MKIREENFAISVSIFEQGGAISLLSPELALCAVSEGGGVKGCLRVGAQAFCIEIKYISCALQSAGVAIPGCSLAPCLPIFAVMAICGAHYY
ncbi:hypothetical protein KUV28_15630 [Ferrimonas balearica]|nr:hypothetical protein [Ferrimonas balearica]